MAEDVTRGSRVWMFWSLGGLATWIAVTVVVSAGNDDPSDPAPVLRTFAICGAVFFGITFGAAGVQMRRSRTRATTGLYRRLALREVSDEELRAATKGVSGIGPIYLFFGAATTGLMLLAIGLNDEDVFPKLLWATVGLVVVWAVYAGVALRRAFTAGDALVAPLGLRLTETPTYLANPGGGGQLAGALAYGGERHGRQVGIQQLPTEARTLVVGMFANRRISSPQQMGGITGEPWTAFRKVEVTAGADGVLVHRVGNGAGRWLLTDLLLAEAVADG